MHNDNVEAPDDRMGDIRTAIESADDTGMVSQQELLHVVGDTASSGDERDVTAEDADAE